MILLEFWAAYTAHLMMATVAMPAELFWFYMLIGDRHGMGVRSIN